MNPNDNSTNIPVSDEITNIPVSDEITPEMLAELSHGKGDDNHE